MPRENDTTNMALFCDFENVALGVRDANYEKFDIQQGARAAAAQGLDRREEGVLRLGPLQGVQGADARGELRADRDPARAPVGQELGGHPHGRRRARPLLHQGARRHVRHHQRRLRLLAAGLEAAREREDGDRRRRQELDVRPADRELRRVHLLRRPRARRAQARREEDGREAARRQEARAEGRGQGGGEGRRGRGRGRGCRSADRRARTSGGPRRST